MQREAAHAKYPSPVNLIPSLAKLHRENLCQLGGGRITWTASVAHVEKHLHLGERST